MGRAADPRQLRARHRRLRRAGRAPARRLPLAAPAGHEPRAAAGPRRGDLARPVARPSRPARPTAGSPPCATPSRSACSASARATPGPASRWTRTTPRRSARSACGSTGCRSRSSSPPRGWGPSRPGRSPSASGDSLAVLTAGSRAALDRQQTLRATLSWSHDLLTGPERTLLRRLAVFEGSFTLEAGGVRRRRRRARAPRDRRPARPPGRQVARRHRGRRPAATATGCSSRCASTRASAWPRRARRPRCRPATSRSTSSWTATDPPPDRLEAEHDNLRAAFDWALRRAPEQALALAVGMWPMWMAGSHFQEGSRRIEAALAAAPAPTAVRAQALRGVGGPRGAPRAQRTGSTRSPTSGWRSSARWTTAARSPTRSTRAGSTPT